MGSERFVCHATHAGLALPWHFDCNLGTRLLLVAGYDDRFGLLFTAVKIAPGDGNPSLRGQTTGQSPRLNYAGMPRYCSDSLGHNQATPCHFVSWQSPLFSRTV